ncbi:hypothetical protein [Meridianimarinicoccus sp. MJW13]|uniref:hypothetical protein n=1 Tax=Meridianimarinicoccus sp. MJW13 TaxID=2720031 RepID=UPI001867BD78|nr:hypothetical protein [Fluviibacterium sp. MJW13]
MDTIILFRIAERLTLTAVVLLVALVVMIGFWRTVQKINLAEGAPLGLGGSFVFSTPVFVLMALIGYAWVSLEHPIEVTPVAAPEGMQVAEGGTPAGGFTGVAPLYPDAGPSPQTTGTGYDASVAQRQLRSLNCLIDGQTLSARTEIDVTDVKLSLLAGLWQPAWGNRSDFADWARNTGGPTPSQEARTAWSALHPLC